MTEEILDRNLDEDVVRMRLHKHYTKWAKRWSWISVIILFTFILFSGVLIPVFDSKSDDAGHFLNQTLALIGVFIILLTISNICSLYFRWKGFHALVEKAERDYFNLFLSIFFLLAPIILILLFLGF